VDESVALTATAGTVLVNITRFMIDSQASE